MMFRARKPPRIQSSPFQLAIELRVLAVGLFAVAGTALWMSTGTGTTGIAPVDVLGAAGIIVVMFVLNITVGLTSARKTARQRAAAAVENYAP